MHTHMREAAAWLLVALAGCALAPSIDDEQFGVQTPDAALAPPDAAPVPSGADAGYAIAEIPAIPQVNAIQHAADAAAPALDAQLSADSDAGSWLAPDAAGSSGTGDASQAADSSARPADAAAHDAAASCQPARCSNNCALLNRCCNATGQCACEEPLTRMCTLSSL